MCNFEVERLKLNVLYNDIAAGISREKIESFEDISGKFLSALRARYEEFCSTACIEEKAREFAARYCATRKHRVHRAPAAHVPLVMRGLDPRIQTPAVESRN
ncbi:MAG: hypothetical protein EPN75_01785 [Beijerinckiaceae bacterium]|nr:MAG: hypothetical protein EPN75_01785 [Beijerinckiaceae bacterium]